MIKQDTLLQQDCMILIGINVVLATCASLLLLSVSGKPKRSEYGIARVLGISKVCDVMHSGLTVRSLRSIMAYGEKGNRPSYIIYII